ncbi:Fe-S protein assembly co-chaperone HscB [Robbsia sp. KACC 23696]|uniref:Fe-S protein assembly co-chaperone HscB n=1 Tax=Robbsia sp. KACC 23696 TaxID=3149231 RepID=UPI00325B234E
MPALARADADHFDLFDLDRRFGIDTDVLAQRYRTIQSQVHPDRFAAAGEAQKRIAMQWATRANEGFQTLRDPLARALYLLKLRGIDASAERNTTIAPAFLMQQMEWRETIDDAAAANNVDALDSVLSELQDERRQRFDKLAGWLDSGADQPAADTARELLFIQKVMDAARKQIERLEDV